MQSAPLTEAAFQTPYMKEDLPKPHICPILFGLSILSVVFHSVLSGFGSRLQIHQG